MKASVVINTYNRGPYIESSIRSLVAQTYRNLELIVVNGPSTDNTVDVLDRMRAQGVPMKYASCASRNLSESRNIGIANAAGDVVLFIDDDAVAHPRWVERLMATYVDPSVGAAGGFTIDHTGISYQCKYTVCDRMGNAQFFDTLDPTPLLQRWRNRKYPSLLGTNCSFRRSELLAIGGFDEVFAYMLDETDVCLRIFDRQRRVVTVPDALVFHKYAPSHSRTPERIPRSLLAPARSKVYFMLKHRRNESVESGEVFREVEQYRRDIEFSNRWYLDHEKVTVEHFNRLMSELSQGIAEGLKLGFDPTVRTMRPAVLEQEPPPFEPIAQRIASPAGPRKLRIYFVSQGFPPNDTSGIARWTHECAHAIAALGHEVHVVTRSRTEASHVDYVDGIWVHSVIDAFPDESGQVSPSPIPDSIERRASAVLAEIKRSAGIWGVDIVSAPIWDVEGILCARYLDVPVVTSLHTTYRLALPFKPDWQSNRSYRKRHVDLVIGGEHWLLENSAGILANSRQIVSEIEESYRTRLSEAGAGVVVVPHGLTDPLKPGRSASAAVRAGSAVKVLFVGRIEERKGQDWFLRAIQNLPPDVPQLEIDFVGSPVDPNGDFAQSIQTLANTFRTRHASSRITFHGYVDEAELQKFYIESDFLVATSRFESFGLILIEAMSYGKPAIGARVGGMTSVIDDGREGFLVPVDDVGALRDRFVQMARSRELRNRLGKAARERFEREFTSEAMARGVVAFFGEVIKQRKSNGRVVEVAC